MDELYYNKVSEEYVEALEDLVAYRIGIGDLLGLFPTVTDSLFPPGKGTGSSGSSSPRYARGCSSATSPRISG